MTPWREFNETAFESWPLTGVFSVFPSLLLWFTRSSPEYGLGVSSKYMAMCTKGSVLGTHNVEELGDVYTNMADRKCTHVTPRLLHKVYTQTHVPEIILDIDWTCSCGGANVCRVHQLLSPNSAVPNTKTSGQLTDIVPATVLCHKEVFQWTGIRHDQFFSGICYFHNTWYPLTWSNYLQCNVPYSW